MCVTSRGEVEQLEQLFTTSSGIRIQGVCSRPYLLFIWQILYSRISLLREGNDSVKIQPYTSMYSLEKTSVFSVQCNWTSGLFAWTVIKATFSCDAFCVLQPVFCNQYIAKIELCCSLERNNKMDGGFTAREGFSLLPPHRWQRRIQAGRDFQLLRGKLSCYSLTHKEDAGWALRPRDNNYCNNHACFKEKYVVVTLIAAHSSLLYEQFLSMSCAF